MKTKKRIIMNLKEKIKEIITGFHVTTRPALIKRELELPLEMNQVISLIGVRRCGKTYLLFDTINRLIEKNLPVKNILYINFEDERISFDQDTLDLIIQAWHEIHNGQLNFTQYFFFDEIQNVKGWEKFIRRIYDTQTKHIYITGSNSSFLAKEIATSLRGRTIQFEVFPFSFSEFIRYRNIEPDYYNVRNKAVIINNFYDYLVSGGFPDTLSLPEREKSELLRNYYYAMLYKDLIERYNITATVALRRFIEKLADNSTKPFSINKIYNDLRSQGIKLDKNLLYELIIYLENIYLSFKIAKFSYSFASRNRSDKKVYFIDNGLLNVLTHSYSSDHGKLLENIVFVYFRSIYGDIFNDSIFYYSDNYECDFIITEKGKAKFCVQVCSDLSNNETKAREIRGLTEAMDYFKHKEGFIITADYEDVCQVNEKNIIIMPAWKAMLNKNFILK